MQNSNSRLMGFRVIGIILLLSSFYMVYYSLTGSRSRNFWDKNRFRSEVNIYDVAGKWNDENGKSVKLADLKGKPALISFVYLNCKMTCPRIVADMKLLNSKLQKLNANINYKIFTFADERTNLQSITEFKKRYEITDSNWEVYTASPEDINILAKELNLQYEELGRNQFTYVHTNYFAIVDENGIVKKHFRGLQTDYEKFALSVLEFAK